MRGVPQGRFYAENEFTVGEAVERLARTVEHKESRYEPGTKRTLTVLLDAYNVPEASISSVQAELRKRIGAQGFGRSVAGSDISQAWKV